MRLSALALALALTACQAEEPDVAPEIDAGAIERAVDGPAVDAAPSARLNLNTATEDEFRALGIGDKMAHEFDEYRPYTSVRQFRQEIGKYIDDDAAQLAEYERMVFVPVDPNASDAETVGQLPGLDAATSAQLVEGRPYADDDTFLARYAELAPGQDPEAVRVYLDR